MSMVGHNGGPSLLTASDGWIARYRSVRTHWLVGHGLQVKPADPSRKRCHTQGEAWEDMTMECRYDGGFVDNGGRKMRLERGSLLGAVSWLAARWNWTPQTVRTFLDKLESDGMILRHVPGSSQSNKHVGKQATVITVCNYERFQNPTQFQQQTEQQTSSKQTTNDQQTSNNIYKDNKGTKEQRNKEEDPQTPIGGSMLELEVTPKLTVRSVAREAFREWQDFAREYNLAVPRDSTFETFAADIIARLREHASEQTRTSMLDVWHLALCHVARSKFLRGFGQNDFKAELAMITRKKNFAKLISGGYDGGATALSSRWRMGSPFDVPKSQMDDEDERREAIALERERARIKAESEAARRARLGDG